MAASYGNKHVVKESEVEGMKKAGTWSAWLKSAFSMSECHPAAGDFEVVVIEDETGARPGWSPTRRLLIVGCSATKDPAAGLLPALDRYRGAYYQMIRQVPAGELPEIVILSAELGFIRSSAMIPDYDRRLTKVRVGELLKTEPGRFPEVIRRGCFHYDEVCVAAGWLYRKVIDAALDSFENRRGFELAKVYTSGGIGTQRSQLKAWLNQGGK